MKVIVISRAMMNSWLDKKMDLLNSDNVAIISINTYTHWNGQFEEETPFDKFEDFTNNKNLLKLWFDDVSEPTTWNGMEDKLFNADDARKVVEFIKEKQDNVDTFIVHCTAGISRSGAVGMFIKDYFGCEIESENSLMPNPLVSAELRKFAWWNDGENN